MSYSFFISQKTKGQTNNILQLQSPESSNTGSASHLTIGVMKWPVSYSADLHNNVSRPFGVISLVCVTFRLH